MKHTWRNSNDVSIICFQLIALSDGVMLEAVGQFLTSNDSKKHYAQLITYHIWLYQNRLTASYYVIISDIKNLDMLNLVIFFINWHIFSVFLVLSVNLEYSKKTTNLYLERTSCVLVAVHFYTYYFLISGKSSCLEKWL